ncbi:MAG: tRNA adenosine(34) deaminase TadA [Pauljensenia sp.]
MDRLREAMGRALFLANRAREGGDVPVGAAVLDSQGRIVGEGWNRREQEHDPSAHAEVIALREAGGRLGRWNLVGCTLVVTLEPCTMCAGAAVQARVDRVVFAAWDPKAGAAGSVRDVLRDSRLNHRVEVIGGILEEEATIQLRGFFESVRAASAVSSTGRQSTGTVRSRPRPWERGQSGSGQAPTVAPTAAVAPAASAVAPPTAAAPPAASPSTRATPSRCASTAGGPGTRGEARLPSRRDRVRGAAIPTGTSAPAGPPAPRATPATPSAVAQTSSAVAPVPAEPAASEARPVPRPGSPTVPGGVPPLAPSADAATPRSDEASTVRPATDRPAVDRPTPPTRRPSTEGTGGIPVRRRRHGDARH